MVKTGLLASAALALVAAAPQDAQTLPGLGNFSLPSTRPTPTPAPVVPPIVLPTLPPKPAPTPTPTPRPAVRPTPRATPTASSLPRASPSPRATESPAPYAVAGRFPHSLTDAIRSRNSPGDCIARRAHADPVTKSIGVRDARAIAGRRLVAMADLRRSVLSCVARRSLSLVETPPRCRRGNARGAPSARHRGRNRRPRERRRPPRRTRPTHSPKHRASGLPRNPRVCPNLRLRPHRPRHRRPVLRSKSVSRRAAPASTF